ncbi:hydroxyproline O-galactosyltransferase GALT3 isoform X2 [Primulina tabacum]|uniref:hydroxyproline O-galactosyltransferase GALT3 isoform X2 n=1 Tax=Primulina tabacum TaxID=48773 RepID=UPI003F5AA180
MKKWTGGLLIVGLAFILVLSYSFIGKPESPRKQSSAYEFFNPHPPEEGNSDGDDNLSLAKKERLRVVQKKPQLIHLQGLSDLYSLSENVTDEESDALLVWRNMRFLFTRSDALPETAQGIKEALAIWKDLLPMIEKDKALRLGDTTANEIENCPYFVKASNNELEIPCGLLEDSSITLIGIPNSEKDSFQIELIGQRELKPPIVLQYKVFLPGENLTKEPFTIQNTWTKESGWGMEERCPDHRMSGVLRVDGLIKCNIQIGQRTAEESLNASHPTYRKFANVSGGTVSASTALHFVEGNPFTASLWVGTEGFHMTVNGRHETSFAHRDNLEPWLVNRVSVKGGLTIMSLLAKGLPVTEDVDLADAQNLRAPSLSNKRLAVLIGVFSAGINFERRMAIRRTWMKYDSIESGDVAVRFFIGLTKILSAKFIMKTDDDAFVRINEVLSSLKGKPSNGLLYGSISFDSEPHRDKDNKWYISDKEWPHSLYPPWAHGPGYIISQDIAKFIVNGHMKRELTLFKLEDVGVGIWVEQFEKHGNKIEYVNDDRFHNAGCESDYILAHYQNPRKMLCLWEKLHKDQKPECCED